MVAGGTGVLGVITMRWRGAAGVVWLTLLAGPAHGLQFEQVPTSAGELMLGARGPIVKGDAARLERALAAVPPGRRLLALALDSPGGSVVEGEKLAHAIRAHALTVVIPSNSKCVSACFLLFAAAARRLAASDALVGVHSASEEGEETGTSLAVTTLMARAAAELGVPPAIVGKMVQTLPGRVEWLTPADMASMHVTIYDDDGHSTPPTGTAAAPSGPLPAVPPAPVPPVSVPPVSVPAPPRPAAPGPGFAAGREDRRAWEAWAGGQRGGARDGALFAVQQLGSSHPSSCYGPKGASLGDFTLGCEAARQRLAAVAVRLRTDPDYNAGWNGTPLPAAPRPVPFGAGLPDGAPPGAAPPAFARPGAGPANVSLPVEVAAEYRGAYFCGTQAARLTMQVLPQPAGLSRPRALLLFGPQSTSPGLPSGSFLAEGAIELRGGALTLAPVQWVSQPAGYAWFGLSGRSDDGGRTFGGRINGSESCSSFTLRRTDGAGPTR